MKLRQSNPFIGAPLAQALCADDEVRLKGKALAQTARQCSSPIGAPLAHVGAIRGKKENRPRSRHNLLERAAGAVMRYGTQPRRSAQVACSKECAARIAAAVPLAPGFRRVMHDGKPMRVYLVRTDLDRPKSPLEVCRCAEPE